LIAERLWNLVISPASSVLLGIKKTGVCSGIYLLETAEAKNYKPKEPGFTVKIEPAQSASNEQLTEVRISYRKRIGKRKLSTWRHGTLYYQRLSLWLDNMTRYSYTRLSERSVWLLLP
jgi:hypothetical protein